ncbi:OPT oligopeptide transporter protein-domain-containing protein [Lipomyces arxii]|uniref:OPT oligopeptide transporter protein-domain-containing protein n=1 Tax=Lipomyces arxii TaxID=56418 RepID=UPI0034CF08A8
MSAIYGDKAATFQNNAYSIDNSSSEGYEKKEVEVTTVFVNESDRRRIIDLIAEPGNDLEDVLTGPSAEFMFEKLSEMTVEESIEILTEAAEYHKDDFNFPRETFDKIVLMLKGEQNSGMDHETYDLALKLEAIMMKYHSPYPEVRAVCEPIDDITLPVETIRAYFLGLIWVAIGSFINEFFSVRQPRLSLRSSVLQILLYPCGKFLQYILPDWGFTVRGVRHSLNPGPWNYKEQMFATVMVNVGGSGSNFAGYVITLKLARFFDQKWVGFGFMFLMNFSTQYFGFGMAGILRRWCVYPVKTMWPTVLPTLALNRALLMRESVRPVHGWVITKYKFFFIVFVCSFVYFFVPSFLFQALSTFNWITWIAPQNVTLAIVTGSYLGLGFNPVTTFDWAVINNSSPLVVPFFSTMNQYIGLIIGALMLIGMYWQNYKWTGYLPINTNQVYDNTGKRYNLSRIIDGASTFDQQKYESYSPPYISMGNLITTGSNYALYTMSLSYILLTEWRVIKEAFVSAYASLKDRKISNYDAFKDPMSRMMMNYPEVPDWWFYIVFLLSLVFGIIAFTVWPSTTPVWGLIVILFVSLVMMIPSALIYSVTGFQLVMSNLATILTGYMVPNNGIANMLLRVYGYNMDSQSDMFISDQKMAHYAKLPPRALFRGQMVATFVQTFTTIGAVQFLINSVSDLCTPAQPNKFTCTFPNSLYADSLMFGVVGPVRTFNQLYPFLKYGFLLGAVLSIPVYLLRRYVPGPMKYVHPVVILSGITQWGSTYNLAYFTPGLYCAYVFMYHIRKRYLAWWTKYNYILTSALSAGIAFCGILIFVSINLTNTKLAWWGNQVSGAGVDGARAAALYPIPENGRFGLEPGQFH